VVEATLIRPDILLNKLPIQVLYSIGIHARDVLGHTASQCQTIHWIIDIFRPLFPQIIDFLDVWKPWPKPPWPEPPAPWLDLMPLVDITLGAALVSMRQAFPYPPERITEEFDNRAFETALEGAKRGIEMGLGQMKEVMSFYTSRILR
jgi:hypothetical protein